MFLTDALAATMVYHYNASERSAAMPIAIECTW